MSYKESTRSLIEWYNESASKLNDKQCKVIDTMDYCSAVNIRFGSFEEFIEYINGLVEIMED